MNMGTLTGKIQGTSRGGKQRTTCPHSLLIFAFGIKAWFGRGGGDAIRESTGRVIHFHRPNQKGFRKEGRKACGPA